MGVPNWDTVQGCTSCLKGVHPEGSTVDLPPHRPGLGSRPASCCLAVRQSPLSLRVTAPPALSVLKPFTGLSLAPAPPLAQEGNSVAVCATWGGVGTAHPPQCLALF